MGKLLRRRLHGLSETYCECLVSVYIVGVYRCLKKEILVRPLLRRPLPARRN